MKTPNSRISFAALVALTSLPVASGEKQCGGGAPMQSVSTFLGATLDYAVSDHICCHNHRYAERRGYLASEEVGLFSRLDPNVETVFYDSVCGIPLFVAPRGRTFEEFRDESLHHGWPSFRPQEMVSENVVIHPRGRMESKCGTHLGHNLPQGSVDRYCIDLVCIAGTPSGGDSNSVPMGDGVLSAAGFNSSTYTSSAEQWSGNYNDVQEKIRVGAICVASLAVAGLAGIFFRRAWKRRRTSLQQEAVDSQPSALKTDDMSSGTQSTV